MVTPKDFVNRFKNYSYILNEQYCTGHVKLLPKKSHEWSHHRISSTDLKVRATY